jgi:hypothetical protein
MKPAEDRAPGKECDGHDQELTAEIAAEAELSMGENDIATIARSLRLAATTIFTNHSTRSFTEAARKAFASHIIFVRSCHLTFGSIQLRRIDKGQI